MSDAESVTLQSRLDTEIRSLDEVRLDFCVFQVDLTKYFS